MIRCFQPPYQSAYGIPRARWRNLSSLEKLRVIEAYRQEIRAAALAHNLINDEWKMGVPFDPSVPFVPAEEPEDMERYPAF